MDVAVWCVDGSGGGGEGREMVESHEVRGRKGAKERIPGVESHGEGGKGGK